MMLNNENIILIDDWTLEDLFEDEFWDNSLKILNSYVHSNSFSDVMDLFSNESPNPLIEDRKRKDSLIEFLWELLPTEHQLSFFENDVTVYYIWADTIGLENLIILHDYLINNNFKDVPTLITSTGVYKRMMEEKNRAYKDMNEITNKNDPKERILMRFYNKIQNEAVITLNTPEYVMVSGLNNDKIDAVKDRLQNEKYKLFNTINYQSHKIYVFHPIK